jgi:hypothetical protein
LTKRTLSAVSAAVILGVTTLACSVGLPVSIVGATPTPSPSLTPTPATQSEPFGTPAAQLTAGDTAARCAQRMADLQSFHFSVQPGGAPVQMGPLINSPVPILLKAIEGDVVRPDQMQARITVSTLGIAGQIGLIRDRGTTYLNNPLTGTWEQLPVETGNAFDPSLLFSSEQGLPTLLTALDMQTIGFDEVQGEIAYHLRAKDVEGVDVTGSGKATTATIDAWIGMQTFLLRQATIAEAAAETRETTVWTLVLSAFDQPVKITPPSEP